MSKKQEVYVANPLRLREMLEHISTDNMTIMNEIGEILIELSEIQFCVANPTRFLADSLLDREVLSYGSHVGDLVVKVKGEEDAE